MTPDLVHQFLSSSLQQRLAEAGLDGSALIDGFDLLAEGVLDSFGVIELMADVESHFEVEVDWDDYDPEDILRVGPFCTYVADRAMPLQPNGQEAVAPATIGAG